jgi:hypothetical protein
MKAIEAISKKTDKNDDKDDDNVSGSGTANKGKLLVDATCAPEDINYPTDLKLLNKAREQSEQIIDTLHNPRVARNPEPIAKGPEKTF